MSEVGLGKLVSEAALVLLDLNLTDSASDGFDGNFVGSRRRELIRRVFKDGFFGVGEYETFHRT
jgi:hypothetical protein